MLMLTNTKLVENDFKNVWQLKRFKNNLCIVLLTASGASLIGGLACQLAYIKLHA